MSDSRVHEFDGIYLGGSMIPVIIIKLKKKKKKKKNYFNIIQI